MSDPSQSPYRELTIPAMLTGIAIGICMNAAFVYISLKLGFGMSGSAVAAILGFAVLRGLVRGSSIVENNINQTVASGVNTASSGVAFTLPALFLIGAANPEYAEFRVLPILLAAIAGSFLGVILIIPLRKQLIEFERLRFPSGIAVASLLKSPGAGIRQAQLLAAGFLVAAAFHVSIHFGFFPDRLNFGAPLGLPAWVPIVMGVSFASFGAGLLSGKGGLPMLGGGVLAWWIISPAAVSSGWVPSVADLGLAETPETYGGWLEMGVVYLTMLRPLGIGILIGGALIGVIMSFPALKSAIGSLSAAAKVRREGGGDGDSAQELDVRVLYIGLAIAGVALFIASWTATPDVGLGQASMIAILGLIWLGVAGLIVAQATGMTDISPLSGLALIAVTLMFFLTQGNVVVSIMLGVAVCIGIGQCGDMMTDLRSGHLIGATPRRQQLAQFMVAWIGAPVAIGTVYLLWAGGGGFGPGTDLTAPQAGALQAIIESLQVGDSALDKYVAGTVIGLGLGLVPIAGLGVLVGLAVYLPFYITLCYGTGCVVSMALRRSKGDRWMGTTLIPIAAGFIVGEALTSLTLVLFTLATGG